MKSRIVLADDHAELLGLLQRILEEHYEVVATAADGHELVEQVQRLQPDLAVTDIGMPVMNGLDAVRQLQGKGTRTRFVIHTASADALLATEALRLGAFGYVVKHSSCEELIAALQAAADGEVYVSSSILAELQGILLRKAV